jgi:hypothetical protein
LTIRVTELTLSIGSLLALAAFACAGREIYKASIRQGLKSESSMALNKKLHRSILTRSLAAIVLFCVYGFGMLGTSAILLGASSTAALAHGGGHGGGGGHGFGGGGFRGGGFRGGGFGYGLGFYPGYYAGYYPGYYPYYEDEGGCYLVRQRVMTRYGWRIRRVQVCE